MNAEAAIDWYTEPLAPKTTGVSGAAEIILKKAEEASRHFFDSPFRSHNVRYGLKSRSRILTDLYNALIGCFSDDWDGYGAKAIADNLPGKAFNYLSGFSSKIPSPEFSPEPDGEIAIEWCGENGAVISLSVGLSNRIHFAAIFPDGNRLHGTESYSKESQKILESYIWRIIRQYPNTGTDAA